MADPRFHRRRGPFALGPLAAELQAELRPPAAAEQLVHDVATLAEAGPAQLSFLDNKRYRSQLRATTAGAVFVHPDLAGEVPTATAALVTLEPYRAYALAAQRFYPEAGAQHGWHPSAIVAGDADIPADVEIGAGTVIASGVSVGSGTVIGPNVTIAAGVIVGERCRIGPGVHLTHCLIGHRVRILPGACIGQEGFGFAIGKDGFTRLPQLGRVIVEDDCEIGAGTTIDRGALGDTVIGRGAMIDNLVQIGHNVQIGAMSVIVAQVGISGSTRVGRGVMIGGQAGLAGHLTIGDRAQIAAQSGLMADVPAAETVMGSPAQPIRAFFRQTAVLRRIASQAKTEADG